jgi:SAM-dependent methyltransferase
VSARFVCDDGRELGWRLDRWLSHSAPEELGVLSRATPPVLDVGCGPGRHVLALARLGVMALGVDVAATAVRIAHDRGAPVLKRSIFERVPGAGRWGSALLLDGNIGIGGEPEILLTRIAELLKPGGSVLVEVEPPGTASERLAVRVETNAEVTPSISWAIVGAGDLAAMAARAGFAVEELWGANGRWFGCLVSI